LQLLEHPHQSGRSDRGVDLDMDRLTIEVVGDVEGAEGTPAEQSIAHEVRRPDPVGPPWHVERDPVALR